MGKQSKRQVTGSACPTNITTTLTLLRQADMLFLTPRFQGSPQLTPQLSCLPHPPTPGGRDQLRGLRGEALAHIEEVAGLERVQAIWLQLSTNRRVPFWVGQKNCKDKGEA